MTFTIGSVILIAIVLTAGILFLVLGFGKKFKKRGALKFLSIVLGFILVIYGAGALGSAAGIIPADNAANAIFLTAAPLPGSATGVIVQPGADGGVAIVSPINTYQPTANYAAIDQFDATLTIPGTQYYKLNGNKVTTVAQTNVNTGGRLEYWVDNETYWVKPEIVDPVLSGVNPVQAKGLVNGTATVTLYDQVGRVDVSKGADSIDLGANKQANIEITYQGTAEASSGPFGGVMVVEYNSTIPSVICTGPNLQSSNPFHVTYTVTSTSNTFRQWAYAPSLDDATGTVNRIQCQFKNGAVAAGAASKYFISFITADYYISNAGNIVLDTEKFENQDNTRTGTAKNLPATFGNWSA